RRADRARLAAAPAAGHQRHRRRQARGAAARQSRRGGGRAVGGGSDGARCGERAPRGISRLDDGAAERLPRTAARA
nr:hypothetical protein [Tanacetum cinerariifolium]